MSKLITVAGKPIKFQIWDTAGQEKYHSLARKIFSNSFLRTIVTLLFFFVAMYYRGAAAAILVYDITRTSTFRTLQNWVEELRSKGPKDIALAIAGNKADLEDSREVDRKEAAAYAETIGALYLETSAKDDTNVQDLFIKLSEFSVFSTVVLLGVSHLLTSFFQSGGKLPAPQAPDANVLKANAANLRNNKPPAKSGCC
jgi:Ras-related protein Rab-5C